MKRRAFGIPANHKPHKRVTKKRLEKDIEKTLGLKIKKLGGHYIKLSPEYHKGISDRLVLIFGEVLFVELKREGITTPSIHQRKFGDLIVPTTAHFCIVSGNIGVNAFIAELKKKDFANFPELFS